MQIVKSDTFLAEYLASSAGQYLVQRAIELFREHPHPSVCAIERNLRPGYAISTAIMLELEKLGIVSGLFGNGEREYFGTGADGITAFKAFAEKLRAGIEPAAHWWRHLSQESRRAYLPGGESKTWGELSDADRARLRSRHAKNLDNLRKLESQFSHCKWAGVVA